MPSAPSFRFVRYFSLLSLLAITGVAALLAWLYGWKAEGSLLQQGEQKNLTQLRLMINQWSNEERALVAALLALPAAPAADAPQVQAIAQHFERAAAGTTIRKLKIYTRSGVTVFSSERAQIGERKTDYPGFVAANAGTPYSQLSFRNRFDAIGGALQDVYLIGSYLPLRDARGDIAGVVEIYDDVTPLAQAIRTARWQIVGLTAVLMTALYVALLGVVRRATRLQERNRALEQEVVERARVARETQAALSLAEAARNDAEAARAAADRANRAKSGFLATMSHEVRTPLNGVIGMTEVLLAGPLTERQRAQLQIVHRSSLSLLRLLSDLLEFSCLEAKDLKLLPAPFAPAALLRELVASMQPRAQARCLTLDLHIAADVPARVVADEARLRQVLSNLLSNALKFTHEGGISVELVRAPDAPCQLLFRVRDTGIGIASTDHERIFRPFEQVDGSATRRYGGAGLGLGICRRLVDLMGGQIGVQSVPGRGSTFWFTIAFEPVQEEIESAPPPVDGAAPALGAAVLVVEDDPVNQIVARELLSQIGCEVTLVGNGEQALETLQQRSFDVVLMDLHMPGIDGAETTRQLRALEARRGLSPHAVVGLTADAFPEAREACLAAGMRDVLPKPFTREQLFDALRAALAARNAAPTVQAARTGPGVANLA